MTSPGAKHEEQKMNIAERALETDKQIQAFIEDLSYYERSDLLAVLGAAAEGKVFGVKQEQAKQLMRRFERIEA